MIQNVYVGEQIENIQRELRSGSTGQIKMYDSQTGSLVANKQTIDGIPSDLTLKLSILGRTFAGKKTIAKQLQEMYGGEECVKIFTMDAIIAEALEYVAPKKVEDAVPDPKAKQKKGKQEETGPVDPFEGKNTEEYKKVAQNLKDSFFQDYEGEL